MDKKIDVTIKRVSSNEPNVSKRHTSYDVYHDGKYHTTFKDINDALDHKEKMHKEDLDEAVLSVAQRQKRGQIMRRYAAKIERSREIAKKRLAPKENIKKRAYAQARHIVRTRVAGTRGAEYEKLGPSEKIAIDRAVEGKQKLIKKLALRLIPRVKAAEQQRLHTFMKGQQLQNHGQPEGKHKESDGSGQSSVREDFNQFFAESFPPMAERSERSQPKESSDTVAKKKGGKKVKGNQNIIQYSKFEEERDCDSSAYKAIAKKARNAGISEDVLGEVYNRGLDAWSEDISVSVSQQQYAFARVNSYINQGKSYFNEDSDLHELSTPLLHSYLDKAKKTTPMQKPRKVRGSDPAEHNETERRRVQRNNYMKTAVKNISKKYATEETQIDELSTKTLDRYVNKASSDFTMSNVGARSAKDSEKPHFQDRVAKRRKGIARAIDKTDAATGREPEKPVKVPATNEAREPGKAYVKRVKRNDGESMLVSSTKWGQKKYWRDSEGGLKKAREHSKADIQEEVQQTNENFIDGKGPGKSGDAARHGLKGKSASELKKIRSSETASPRQKQLAHWMLNMHHNEETELDEVLDTPSAKQSYEKKTEKQIKKINTQSSEPTDQELNTFRKRKIGLRMLDRKKYGADTARTMYREETELDEGGLWDNIHAKRKRIKAGSGSGERMRKPGSKGAPTKQDFKDAQESIEEGYDVNDKHYKALTDLDLNTKNRDMTTKHDGYGPLNPMDKKGSKAFWEDKAKLWDTTVEAAMEARCGNCAAFNQSPAIMKKMAEGLGPASAKIQELANLGFCELFEFKCAGSRTCNKWLVNGPITEEDTGNGTALVDKESKNSKARRKIEKVDRDTPHTELGKQAEIQNKVIDEEGNSQSDPKKRLVGTDSLVKAYKKDTPGQTLDESFNIAYASGVGVTLTARDLGMQTQGGFALHPSVIEEMKRRAAEEMEEEVRSADVKGVVVRTASGKAVVRKQKVDRKIIGTGNLTDGKPDDTV